MEPASFAMALADLRPGLVAYAYACCRDRHLAEDLAQEALTVAVAKRDSFSQGDLRAWAATILRHCWMRERERRGLRERTSGWLHEHAADLLLDQPADIWERERDALRACVGGLGGEDRRLLDGRFRDGADHAGLAQRLGRSVAWTKVRLHRLRAQLAACITRRLRRESGHA